MIKKLIKALPGIRGIVSDRQRILEELRCWKYGQAFPPGHFYSPVPDNAEIQDISQRSGDRNVPEIPGVSLNWNGQEHLLREISRFYDELPFGDTEAQRGGHRYYFENGFYTYGDGVFLCCLLRHLRPRRLIEIGSGFSSCLAMDVNDLFLEGSMQCTFIEPYPARLKENMRNEDHDRVSVIEAKVQGICPSIFSELRENDVLFIDSSHVGKSGSDVNFILFEVLPRIHPGVWIHFHDVFYPFEYPESWITRGRSWNEAYLVRCLLTHSSAYHIRLWGDSLFAQRRPLLESLMPVCLRDPGAGIWIQKSMNA